MKVSFKVNKKGSRFRPKSKLESTSVEHDDDEVDEQDDDIDEVDEQRQLHETQPPPARDKRPVDVTEDEAGSSDADVSLIVSIFLDGYLIKYPFKNTGEDDLKQLRPYDRHSEHLFAAIEHGQIPFNFLDEMHFKYVNGTILCEVQDYRKKSEPGVDESSSSAAYPRIAKVSLTTSQEQVAKDFSLMSNESWNDSTILEADARILRALQPKHDLDPTPKLDRLCKEPTCIKLNLDIRALRLERLRQMSRPASAPVSSNTRAEDSRTTVQHDFEDLGDQNVGQRNVSATRPINPASECSNLEVQDSRPMMDSNLANQNADESNMIPTRSVNNELERSNVETQDSRPILGSNLANQNVDKSNMILTRPVNNEPESSNVETQDSRLITGQSESVNLANQNIGESNMIPTRPVYNEAESSNFKEGDSKLMTGQPELVNLANQNVGQSNTISARPISDEPESSNAKVGDSRLLTGQPDFVNMADLDIDQSNLISTSPLSHELESFNLDWDVVLNNMILLSPVSHEPESSKCKEADLEPSTGQPDFVNLANQNVGQSNVSATGPINHAPESSKTGDSSSITSPPDFTRSPINHAPEISYWRAGDSMLTTSLENFGPYNSKFGAGDSRQMICHPDFVNMGNQNVSQESNMIATSPMIYASEYSTLRARDSTLITGQPNFENLANQISMITERLENYAPGNFSLGVGELRHITSQMDYVNLSNQNVGQSNMTTNMPANHALESSNIRVRDSRKITCHPDLVNMGNKNVGQESNTIATRPINYTPENSNMWVGDSSLLTDQHDYLNLGNQNVCQSSMIPTRPVNHALESSNVRSRDLRLIAGQCDYMDLTKQDIGQQINMISTRPVNHAVGSSNFRGDNSRLIKDQYDILNLSQNVGQRNIIATKPGNHALEHSNWMNRDSGLTLDQLDSMQGNWNFGQQSNITARRPINHSPEGSNLKVGDSRSMGGQHDFVNPGNQNVSQQSNSIATWPINYAPNSSNLRPAGLRSITSQLGLVNMANQNVGQQNNMIATRHVNHGAENSNLRERNSRAIMDQGSSRNTRHMQGCAPTGGIHFGNDMNPHMSDGISSNVHGKRGNQDVQMVNANKRSRVSPDGNQLNRGRIQPWFDDILNRNKEGQQGVKPEILDTQRMDRVEPQHFTRSNFHQASRNNTSQNLEENNNNKKEEFLSGSVGRQFESVVGSSQRVNPLVNLGGGTRSLTLSGNESTSSVSKTTKGVGSSSSVASSPYSTGNIIGPFTPSSPIDRSMQDRLSAIQMLTLRHKLIRIKNRKYDDFKPTLNYSTQQLKHFLCDDDDENDDSPRNGNCKMPLSMSLAGGSMNTCKMRVLNFAQNDFLLNEENELLVIPKMETRLILSERARDGTVAMHLGEPDDYDHLAEDELLPTLSNTRYADLLAKQFCYLMLRDGFILEGDDVEVKPASMVESTTNASSGAFAIEYIPDVVVFSCSMNEVAEPVIGGNTVPTAMLPPQSGGLVAGVSMASSNSQLSGPQSSSLYQQQVQRSPTLMGPGSMGWLGNHMVSTNNRVVSPIQHHQSSQPQQQSINQRMGDGGSNNRMMGTSRGRGSCRWPEKMGRSPLPPRRVTPLTPIHAAFIDAGPMFAHSKTTSASGGILGQSSNIGGLLGSSGVSMENTSGINRVNRLNPMQTNAIAQPKFMFGPNKNPNQQPLGLTKQEPSWHLQAVEEVNAPLELPGILQQGPSPVLVSQPAPVNPVTSCVVLPPSPLNAGSPQWSPWNLLGDLDV